MNFDALNLIFRNPSYKRNNNRRQEHLATLGLDVFDKSVLELGAGLGDHTSFFLDRGCTVTSIEARPENCKFFAATMEFVGKHGYFPAAKWNLIEADVNALNPTALGKFDIVYAYGIFYHLADPDGALKLFAAFCGDLLLLETCVSVGDYEAANIVTEPKEVQTQAFDGLGCRPTRPWIFNRLRALFPYVYVPKTQPVHEDFPIDWTVAPKTELTRAVFIASRQPIDSPMLLSELPAKQSYR